MGYILALFFLLISMAIGAKRGCGRLEGCSREFQVGLEEAGIKEPEPSLAYCQELRLFGQCVKRTTKGCRGDLSYHSSSSLVETLAKRYNCSQHKIKSERRQNPTRPAQIACTYHSKKPTTTIKECGLYGAPDLRTFSSHYQKCNVVGTWPLLDNDYLAIQITNSPIDQSLTVATTKVTVIIKTTENGCATEKTYEATSEAPLPEYFIDGTDSSEKRNSVLINSTSLDKLRVVDIHLRYIETHVSVRQVGPYLGCSVTMPEDIIGSLESSGEVELCRRGCPRDYQVSDGPPWPHWCSRQYSENNGGVSSDWCVFELMSGILAEPAVADFAYRTVSPIYLFFASPLMLCSLYL